MCRHGSYITYPIPALRCGQVEFCATQQVVGSHYRFKIIHAMVAITTLRTKCPIKQVCKFALVFYSSNDGCLLRLITTTFSGEL